MKGIKAMAAFWILTYILVGWVGVYAVQAKPDCPLQGVGRHGGMFKQFLARLDLSDSQEHDIANLLKQHREQMQGLRTQMMEARKSQLAAMMADPFSEDAMREAAAKAADIQVQLAVTRARVFDEIRKLLTPDQQATLQQVVTEFSSRRQKGFEHKARMLDRWIDENSSL